MTLRSTPLVALLLSTLLIPAHALAGPPLVCHEVQLTRAPALAWNAGSGWRGEVEGFDLETLVERTVAILDSKPRALVRMETLRRATIYATHDRALAQELFDRVRRRALEVGRPAEEAAHARFDLGYLAEIYAQASTLFRERNLGLRPSTRGVAGLARVQEAIQLSNEEADMVFAAALITSHPRREGHLAYLVAARKAARHDAEICWNLKSMFGSPKASGKCPPRSAVVIEY